MERRMETRTKLLLAAERLFALHGPEGATSRAILAEAGQKNASAINYYFPTRDTLIEAICQLRMEPIDRQRIERVTQYLSDKPPAEERLRTLVTILCEPGLKPLIEAKGKSYFRRFLAQAINTPSSNFDAIVRDRFDVSVRQLAPLIRDELPQPPRAIANKRISMMVRSSGYMAAHLEARSEGQPWTTRQEELAFELELMIDAFVGLLRAPHTAAASAQSSTLKRYAERETLDRAMS
jgi:AcrR family transcriptional regulator